MTSTFFNNFNSQAEQNLLEDLIIESIKIYGHEILYIPRTLINKDALYGEDTVSEYNSAFNIDAYIKSYDGYGGDSTFLSKFNLEIRDQMILSVSPKVFSEEVGIYANIIRPREGDLIYSSMMKRLFSISYINDKAVFYQMGSLQFYDMTCEVFEYSNEKLRTGVQEIDDIESNYSTDISASSIDSNNIFPIADDSGLTIVQSMFDDEVQNSNTYSDNFEIKKEGIPFVEWSVDSPFGGG